MDSDYYISYHLPQNLVYLVAGNVTPSILQNIHTLIHLQYLSICSVGGNTPENSLETKLPQNLLHLELGASAYRIKFINIPKTLISLKLLSCCSDYEHVKIFKEAKHVQIYQPNWS